LLQAIGGRTHGGPMFHGLLSKAPQTEEIQSIKTGWCT